MTTDNHGPTALPRLLSVPGLVGLAVFGIVVIVVSRVFGPENILREVIVELLASFGSTILLLAIFGLLFRSGLQRLLRGAPGGESIAQSVERLGELLQGFDQGGRGSEDSRDEEQLDRIEEVVRGLSSDEIPRLKEEIRELRNMLSDHGYGREERVSE